MKNRKAFEEYIFKAVPVQEEIYKLIEKGEYRLEAERKRMRIVDVIVEKFPELNVREPRYSALPLESEPREVFSAYIDYNFSMGEISVEGPRNEEQKQRWSEFLGVKL